MIAPATQTFDVGENRYAFGVFTPGLKQISDADVAVYFAKDGKGPVIGPLPAQVTSLETKPAYRAAGRVVPARRRPSTSSLRSTSIATAPGWRSRC